MPDRRISARRVAELLGDWRADDVAYRALASALRFLVLDGRLALGVRLPGERELASQLGVSRTTVTAALALLDHEGFVTGDERSAKRTCLPRHHDTVRDEGALVPVPEGSDIIDFAGATPDGITSSLHRAMRTALDEMPEHMRGHGYSPDGLASLRRALAAEATERGAHTEPVEILVTNGALHALALALRTFASPGDRVVIEQPTYPHAIDAIARASLRAVPVPVGHGWDLDELVRTIRRTRAAVTYLIPDHQNPTGLVLDGEARRRLVSAVSSAGSLLVIDETSSHLALDGPIPRAIPIADGRSAVAIGSASKLFWGGLRVGWMRGPRSLLAQVAAARHSLDLGTAPHAQLTVKALLDDRAAQDERRASLRLGRDHLVGLVRAHFPHWQFTVPSGGMCLWVDLGERTSTRLAAAARSQQLRLAPGPRFGTGGTMERCLRLPYALPIDEMDEAIDRLAIAARSIGRASARVDTALVP
jgi:DNA-binding transcriptional MocR family regulator